MVEIGLIALLCVCAIFVVWSKLDDTSCGPMTYRDPITGRMARLGEAKPNAKARIACALPGQLDNLRVPPVVHP
ncbi:MAG: hypothetical protein ACHQAY_07335 [Hyphomicrobiales bacterium]